MESLSVETDGTSRGARLATIDPFKRGQIVYDFANAPLASAQTYQTVQISKDQHVLVDSTLAKLNHACDPNVLVITRRRLVIALRAILPGEELTYFYPSTEWDMAEPFLCLCGSPQCLGWIRGARHLPVSTLENYYISPHIRALVQHALAQKTVRTPVIWRAGTTAQTYAQG
jgi:hypothetical protein